MAGWQPSNKAGCDLVTYITVVNIFLCFKWHCTIEYLGGSCYDTF